MTITSKRNFISLQTGNTAFTFFVFLPVKNYVWSLGGMGRNGAKLSEMKYAPSRLSETKKKKKARGRTLANSTNTKLPSAFSKKLPSKT